MSDGPLILDGREVARVLRGEIAAGAAAFEGRHGRRPGLAVIVVGDDPASHIYVRMKAKACEENGFHSRVENLPADTTRERLLSLIGELNGDAAFDGILVQSPPPPHIDEMAVVDAISPGKDVDGFHTRSAGDLLLDRPGFVPCTPLGIMKMLDFYGIDPAGRHAVIIGRSHIVGKPAALLLLRRNATVTVCHSRTRDLAGHTGRADIVVAAVGRPGLLTAGMVKPGAVVVDVGVNRIEGRKVVGDADFEGLLPVVSAITPVPGGVGPMTITMLLANTLRAARLSRGEEPESSAPAAAPPPSPC